MSLKKFLLIIISFVLLWAGGARVCRADTPFSEPRFINQASESGWEFSSNRCARAISDRSRPEVKPAAVKPQVKKPRPVLASRKISRVQRMLRQALSFLGTPYLFGGNGSYGIDCSGFVYRIFALSGKSLPRDAPEQYYSGQKVPESQLSPGDLVFFSTYTYGPSHVGIYLGGDKFIHSSTSRGVIISNLQEEYYRYRYIGARRF